MSYKVRVSEAALRDLAGLPADAQRRIGRRIDALAGDPRPATARGLSGSLRGILRLRVGSYRLSDTIDDEARMVDVWRVGHHSTFCRRVRGR